jgi:hypothetical protein
VNEDTEGRTKRLLEQIAAGLPPLDEHTTKVWGSILDEQARAFDLRPGVDAIRLLHTCRWEEIWEISHQDLGLNQVLVTMFDHLLVCPDFPRGRD